MKTIDMDIVLISLVQGRLLMRDNSSDIYKVQESTFRAANKYVQTGLQQIE